MLDLDNPSDVKKRSLSTLATIKEGRKHSNFIEDQRNEDVKGEYMPFFIGAAILAAVGIFSIIAFAAATGGIGGISLILSGTTTTFLLGTSVVGVAGAIGLAIAGGLEKKKQAESEKALDETRDALIGENTNMAIDNEKTRRKEYDTQNFEKALDYFIETRFPEVDEDKLKSIKGFIKREAKAGEIMKKFDADKRIDISIENSSDVKKLIKSAAKKYGLLSTKGRETKSGKDLKDTKRKIEKDFL